MGKGVRRRDLLLSGSSLLTAYTLSGSVFAGSGEINKRTLTAGVTADEAQKIARDAYIFAFPLNYYYRTIYAQVVDPNNKKNSRRFRQMATRRPCKAGGQGNYDAEQRHALQLGVGGRSQRTLGASATPSGRGSIL